MMKEGRNVGRMVEENIVDKKRKRRNKERK